MTFGLEQAVAVRWQLAQRSSASCNPDTNGVSAIACVKFVGRVSMRGDTPVSCKAGT
jgi:hypothetical protein